jgi:D-3-phosphoglycerate dehydrogenase
MPKVLITQEFIDSALDELEGDGVHVDVRQSPAPMPYEELVAAIAGYDAVLCLLTDRIDRPLFDANPQLRVVANCAVGFDNIDVAAATERGVAVLNTPGVLTHATADLAMTLLLSVARRVPEADAFMRAGSYRYWRLQQEQLGLDVTGQDLGIFGMGKIGRAVAAKAQGGFDMRVRYYDAYRLPEEQERDLGVEYVTFDELIATSDYLSIHAPLTPETHHAVGAEQFAAMKDSAVLINTARGPIIDEAALVEALRVGQIAGAGLDVYEYEPDMVEGLAQLTARVVLLPHLGSATENTRLRMARMCASGIRKVLAGERPDNVVNPEALEDQQAQG